MPVPQPSTSKGRVGPWTSPWLPLGRAWGAGQCGPLACRPTESTPGEAVSARPPAGFLQSPATAPALQTRPKQLVAPLVLRGPEGERGSPERGGDRAFPLAGNFHSVDPVETGTVCSGGMGWLRGKMSPIVS